MTRARNHLRAIPAAGPRRAVLYRRVSALMGRSGEQFMSPDLQLAAMRDMAKRRDLVEVEVIDDIDVSGRTFAREGISRVLELARARQIDVVAFYDLARLGRNVRESLRVIEELRELGVAVMSANEQIDDSPEGQFQLTIWLGMAQLYSDQIARRWADVVTHRTESGLHHGQLPLGYRRAGRRIEPDPEVAPAVLAMFRSYAAGQPIGEITARWRAATGLLTPRPTLKRVLRNPVYVGQVRAQGTVRPGQHDRIVDDRTWRRVQDRLDRDATAPPRTLDGRSALSGLMVCDSCGYGVVQVRDERGTARLTCSGRRNHLCEAGAGRPAVASVEAEVRRRLVEHLRGQTVDLGAAEVRRAKVGRARVDAGRVRREIAQTQQALGTLAADRARRAVTQTAYDLAAVELEATLTRLRTQLEETERTARIPVADRQTEEAARALEVRWERMTPSERSRAVRMFVRQVRLRAPARHGAPVVDRVEVVFL